MNKSNTRWDLRWCLLTAVTTGCGQGADGTFCQSGACGWSEQDIALVSGLADLPATPPPDRSNKYVGNPTAESLGQQFYYDPRFSGNSTQVDALGRAAPYGKAPKGQPLNLPCVGCHDPLRGGTDNSSYPGNVSIGAGWTDTNTPSVFNLGFQDLILWPGRVDSIWAQAVGGNEGSINGTRLKTLWTINDLYRDTYEAVFTEWPLPTTGKSADVKALVETEGPRSGQCKLAPGCAAPCREVKDMSGGSSCWPRFPLQGKPGKVAGCQAGDANEPFGDAFDCMAEEDQTLVTRVLVNYAKAIASYEYKLVSRDSAFDRFVHDLRAGEGDISKTIPESAKRGARLFVGKAGCAECHSGPLLSDRKIHNVGVPQMGIGVPTVADCPMGGACDCVTPKNCLPFGARDGLDKLHGNKYRRDSKWSDDPTDASRKPYYDMKLTDNLIGAWRTPSLRDVALTAPYMHDGALLTLEDVVRHYNVGGNPAAPGTRAASIKPLFLSAEEEADLVSFLKTLNGAQMPAELITPPPLP